jgi:hypothetical protein
MKTYKKNIINKATEVASRLIGGRHLTSCPYGIQLLKKWSGQRSCSETEASLQFNNILSCFGNFVNRK